ncbi:MAG: ribosome hibernation-promoting factor, HPF/YfiA family [bacterium]
MVRRALRPFNLIIQGRHLDIGEPLKRYAERKLHKLIRHFDQLQKAQAVLKEERHRSDGRAQVVEVTVWGDGLVLRGRHSDGNMRAAIDGVVDKLERQIRKRRSRLIDKRRTEVSRARRRRAAAAEAALRAVPAASMPAEVVRIKRFVMKPMTAEDAIIQIEGLGHAFFVFRNAQTEEINVLYRRQTGDYGVIEPS